MFRTIMAATARPLAATALALVMAAGSAQAQTAEIDPDKVVARVDGKEITNMDLALVGVEYAQDLAQVPAAMRQKVLIDVMIDMELLANAAVKEGLDNDPEYLKHIDYLKSRALRDTYLREKVDLEPTDEELQKIYDEQFADYKGEEERHARHILVKTEDEAKDLVKALDDGKDFAELAKEKSTGPTGPNGGDLGFFTKGQMVPEFDTAVFGMEAGNYTKEPVKTQFGWHVIKLEEVREQAKPTFDQLKDGLKTQVIRARFQELKEKLKADAKIEIVADETADAPKSDGEKTEEGAEKK